MKSLPEHAGPHGSMKLTLLRAVQQLLITSVALFAGLTPFASAPAQAALPVPLQEALAPAGISSGAVGLYIHEVGAAQPLLEHNADRSMNPASVMKLLTTLAGLELLGPNYTWRTEAWLDGPLTGEVLQGNLVLKGYGDPKLTIEDLWLFLRELRARGLREIRGDLVLDRSFFAVEPIDPGQFDNDPTRAYNVGPDALLLNYKSVRLQFVPQEDTSTVRILPLPDLPQVSIINQLALGAGNCDFWPERPQANPEQARLVFTGVFPRGCGEKAKNFSLLGPNEYALALFQQLWREVGGSFSGRVRDGVVPESGRLLATWESPPLAQVIRDINKFSNNVMARQLFLTLALAADNPPVSTDKAARAVREWLARSRLDFPEVQLENGSGLSRNERISPRHLGELLLYGARSPLMPEYASSLPIPGVDGTLRRRLSGSPAIGRAHLKTGYLEGVRAIAGYVVDSRGRMLVVVSIINHPQAMGAQSFQEAVVEWASSRAPQGTCCTR
ncbi:MAG TPA: D-alanyl-D-alanine carboxypeptidase/D-alanyl-D-alanine-endopeptidase [Burkholderiales bacterium]|nr:D-alanyl-D-alanine carboxypeptidase/D-alanyl-D-alanine-endopeptidase [Burkholderiales bacterium]